MLKTLRENWIWIAAPIAVVLLVVALIAWLGTDPAPTPFQYPAF